MKSEEEAELEYTADLVKQRQVFSPSPQPVKRLVNRVITRRGVTQIEGREELVAAWKAVCDPQLLPHTQVMALRHQKLEIRVGHSLVNQQLRFEQERLLSGLQERLPQIKLKGLVFKTGLIDPDQA